MKRAQRGFTLVEVLVVVTILAILASIMTVNFSEGSAQSRDKKRQADLISLQSAIELYKKENGQYPAACRGALAWSGEQGTNYACSGGNTQYIVGLVPEYIRALPTDPKPGSGDYGYAYFVNNARTVYKIVSRNTLESSENFLTSWSTGKKLPPCDVVPDPADGDLYVNCTDTSLPPEYLARCGLGVCNMYYNGSWFRPAPDCSLANVQKTLAAWGGFEDPANVSSIGNVVLDSYDNKVERGTETIICELPP